MASLKVLTKGPLLFLAVFCSLFFSVTAANAATWLKSFVPYNETNTTVSNNDAGKRIFELNDGNFLVASFTETLEPGQDVANGVYFYNTLLQKVDGEGDIIWEYTYGGPTKSNETLYSMLEAADGSILLGGYSDKPGTNDMLVIKLDSAGNLLWQKVFGGLGNDQITDMVEDPAGGYVLAGFSNSAGGFGGNDGIMVKLDISGNVVWERAYGGAGDELFRSVATTADGGFILAGQTLSFGGLGEAWLVKTNSTGDADGSVGTWSRYIGGANLEEFQDVIQTAGGDYLAVGYEYSSDPANPSDAYIVKFNGSGTLLWQRRLDDGAINKADSLTGLAETAGNDFVLAGTTASWGNGLEDGWLVKIDGSGTILWQKAFGDAQHQHIDHVSLASDNGILIAGGNATPTTGKSDIWAGKADANGLFDDADCTTSVNTTATSINPGFAVTDPGKISAPIAFSYQNATHARRSVASNTIVDTSYCVSYLEISGGSSTIAGNSNELTITAYDTSGAVRTNYNGLKTLTFSGLANDGVKFPTVEGTVFGTAQTVTFTAGVSNALTTTLVPQIAESATVSVTDGKLNCNAVNAEASHCLALTVRAPLKTWSEIFDTGGHDQAKTVVEAPDGNYIVGGYTPSLATVQKLNTDGVVIWETALGDASTVTFSNLEVAPDGSIIVGAISGAAGSNDLMAVKLDSSGNILWQNVFGSVEVVPPSLPAADYLSKIRRTADGGYILVGQANVNPAAAPFTEGFIVRLDSSGNLVWQNTYGTLNTEMLTDAIENPDGSFVVTGWSYGPPLNEYTAWVFKIDSAGKLLWSNTYDFLVTDLGTGLPTSSSAEFHRITNSIAVGKFVLAGRNFISNAGSYEEAILMQIDGNGNLEWVYNYGDGTIQSDQFYDLIFTGSAYLLAGATAGMGSGGNDGWFVSVDAGVGPGSQNVSLSKALGDSLNNYFYSFDTTADGGFVFAGRHQHPIPPPGLKQSDIWAVKTDAAGEVTDPNCLTVTDVKALTLRVIPGNKVTDNSAAVTVTGVINPSIAGTLTNQLTGLSKFSFCTAYFLITGAAAMTAGTTNELTITAYDYLGNVVASYDGPKYLNFSGLNPIGAFSPNVEGTVFGTLGRVDFVAGASTLAGATLTAYKDESSKVHATDGVITSVPHDGLPDGGHPLTVSHAALDHYDLSTTTPQTVYVGWTETVTARDLYGNLAKVNNAVTLTNSGQARFFTDNSYNFANNIYNLVNGVTTIFVSDYNAESFAITAKDAAAKSGTSGLITVLSSLSSGSSGSGGSGPGSPVSGGSSAGGYPDPGSQPAPNFLSTPENAEPPSLSCLQQTQPERQFTDIDGHYAHNAIEILSRIKNGDNYVVNGYLDEDGNGVFRPDVRISRAEFLKMALVANCLPIESIDGTGQLPETLFRDVAADESVWYNSFIYSAVKLGIVSGYPDGNFYPDQPITRAEAAKILVNVQKLIGPDYLPKRYFEDVFESDWFFAFVSAAKENGLVFGSSDDNGATLFRPHEQISRADSALILVRILGLRDFLSLGDQNANTYTFLQG